jgi:hypothetical protein
MGSLAVASPTSIMPLGQRLRDGGKRVGMLLKGEDAAEQPWREGPGGRGVGGLGGQSQADRGSKQR